MISFSFRLFLATSSVLNVSGYSTSAAFGVGKAGFDQYRASLPSDFNVVKEGGWYALQQRYISDVGNVKFEATKACLPKDFDVVAVGGFDNVRKLAADPKAELVKIVVDNLKASGGSGSLSNCDGKLDAVVALLASQGKGFSSLAVDGDWMEVLARQGKKSTKSQKLVGGAKKTSRPTSNFNVSTMDFENVVLTRRGNGSLKATVKYLPVATNFDKASDGRIVLRRIKCDITGASFKYWKFPTLRLPFLKSKDGYLDFLYLDNDIRITKGNRGGLFVHFRPNFLEEVTP